MKEKLKEIQHMLVDTVYTQMENIERVDSKELGEVIDIIKDISQTMYYCKVIEAMEHDETKKSATDIAIKAQI